MDNGFSALLFGIALGICVSIAFTFTQCSHSIERVKLCQAVCESNEGMSELYFNGKCVCKNGVGKRVFLDDD